MNKELPRILVISVNAWKDNSGINTLIELFKTWDKDKIAQIYTRSALPKTEICNKFFQISEGQVLRSILKRQIKTGKVIKNNYEASRKDFEIELEENKRYNTMRGSKQIWSLTIARELVWKLGKWKTQELDNFLEEYNADILFIPIYPTIYMGMIQNYIIDKVKKPVVCYISDDNYTYKSLSYNPLSYIHRFILRKVIKKIVSKSSDMFVISPKQKEEYDNIFSVNSKILTKGIDFSEKVNSKKIIGKPIKMVYTGKLNIGRWKTLAKIAESLKEINKEELVIEFDIYTTDKLNNKQNKLLNRYGCTVKGAVTLQEVQEIQKNSDIVVFVESLDNKYKDIARLSFSTKITDYLKNGKCIFAVGDKDIAPIHYLKTNDAALIATSYKEIGIILENLSKSENLILEYSKKSYECGIKNHKKEDIEHILKDTIIKLKN